MNTDNWNMKEIIKTWLESTGTAEIDKNNSKERITIRSGEPNVLKYWHPTPIKNSTNEIWKKCASVSMSSESKDDHSDTEELASKLYEILKQGGDHEYK